MAVDNAANRLLRLKDATVGRQIDNRQLPVQISKTLESARNSGISNRQF